VFTAFGLLMEGGIDLAVATPPETMPERIDLKPLYEERYVVAFPPGHRFTELEKVPLAAVAGESYLSRLNCEYFGYLGSLLTERMIPTGDAHRSEREDWIQSMVMAGLGISRARPPHPSWTAHPAPTEPEVSRRVALATSPAGASRPRSRLRQGDGTPRLAQPATKAACQPRASRQGAQPGEDGRPEATKTARETNWSSAARRRPRAEVRPPT
jgi:DNA-binding transcriptional LysR family regulator